MTAYSAAKKHKIPRQTLERHVSKPEINTVGRPKPSKESEIVQTCQIFSEWGFGLTKMDVTSVVADYFRHMNPIKDGVPGDDWWRLFMKRHRDLTKRKPDPSQSSTPKVIIQ